MAFDIFKKNKNKEQQDNIALQQEEVADIKEIVSTSNDTEEKPIKENQIKENKDEQRFDEDGNPLDENGEPIIFPPPQIKVIISNDRLTAYVRVTLSDKLQPFKEEQIYYALEQSDVIFGIDSDAIKEFVAKRQFFTDLIAARGIRQIDGIDGQIDYLVKTDKEICLKETEDGTVDFRELNVIESVNADEVLAVIQPSTEGTGGTDVFGNAIIPTKGKDPEIKLGENVCISEDGFTVKASISGIVEFNKGAISISRVYIVNGDVNLAIGNLNVEGSIQINGDVREGFTVKASENITVKGLVEGSKLIAGGNVVIGNGMNGSGSCIEARGDVISMYLQNVNVSCDNLYCDTVINCNVVAKSKIVIKGKKGYLCGGSCKAGELIYANVIGSRTNVTTNIMLDSEEIRQVVIPRTSNRKKVSDLTGDIANLTATQSAINEDIKKLSAKMSDPNIAKQVKKAMADKTAVATKIAEIQNEIQKIREESQAAEKYKIVATDTCYGGVKMQISYLTFIIDDQYKASKFLVIDGSITNAPISSADKIS